MNYGEIYDELKRIEESEFNYQEFNNLSNIFSALHFMYGKEYMNKEKDAKSRYDAAIRKATNVAAKKLKEILPVSDKTISNIIFLMNFTDTIEEAYIIDDCINAKILSRMAEPINNYERTHLIIDKKYMNIEFDDFYDKDDCLFKKFLCHSLNNALSSSLYIPGVKEFLLIKDGIIKSNVVGLTVYIDHTISKILSDDTGSLITKLLVNYENKMYSFVMKIHDEYVVLGDNPEKPIILSEVLGKEKEKNK